ncbi:hypothetical protein EBT25_18300, partial [bacterium]|nr:hypothetical protein [bacterium]
MATELFPDRMIHWTGDLSPFINLKGKSMPIKKARLKVAGVMPLLMNNPQTVDRFNDFAKRMSVISAKKNKRTDEDY